MHPVAVVLLPYSSSASERAQSNHANKEVSASADIIALLVSFMGNIVDDPGVIYGCANEEDKKKVVELRDQGH